MAGLEDLYKEIILDHYRSPRNKGTLPTPPATKADGFNPLCGDEVHVYIEMNGDVVSDIKLEGHGCSISQSSASLMSAAVKGKNVEQVRAITKAFKMLMGVHATTISKAGLDPEAARAGITNSEADLADLVADTSNTPAVNLGDLEALQGVVKFPVRIKCATLGWNTMLIALDDALASASNTN